MALAAVAPVTASVPFTAEPNPLPKPQVRVISEFQEFLNLEPVWNDLVDRAGVTHPFLEHCWIRTWWECFGHGTLLHILVVSEGPRTLAIAPLIMSRTKMYGIPIRRLGFFYNSHVPRADFIVAHGRADAYELIWKQIRAAYAWDVLQLCQLTESSQTLGRLQQLAREDGLQTGLWKSGASPRVQLGRGWDEYQQTLPAKHRSNLRNRFKRLNQVGPAELDTVTGGERRPALLQEGLRLESAAWKGEAGTAILADRDITRFYELLSQRAAAHGWLRLNFLRAAGRAVAFDYSLEYRNRIFLLKLGYDPEFSPYSPSNLLLATALKQAFAQGVAEYDFLGEEAEWKRCWTSDVQSNYWLYVFRRSVKGRLLYGLKFQLVPRLRNSSMLKQITGVIAGLRAAVMVKSGRPNR